MVKIEQDRLVRVRDSEILRVMIEDRGWNTRTLADELQRDLRKRRKPTIGTSKSTLHNLIAGERDIVRREVAQALTRVLKVKKWDSLFTDDVCSVTRETARIRLVAA